VRTIPSPAGHVQAFDTAGAVARRIGLGGLGGLARPVAPRSGGLGMLLCHLTLRLAAAEAFFLSALPAVLRCGKALLPAPVIARVVHHGAVRVSQKDLQPNVQSDSKMPKLRLGGMRCSKGIGGQRLADDERVPVPICSQDQLSHYWCSCE